MIKGIIDRFEGEVAVVEINGQTKDYPKTIFPKDATTGDVVIIENGQGKVLKNETEKLRKEVEALMDEVWEE
ncbi:DUF3006 domain-containing protein [Mesobacillus subterraneus]|uniref:DUF3006 domain-containing protein n=1 Tax=Mesobacillus subterraneus TaxID=285983 RepID=A0A3R9E633_9BACI|nr:DUF3006 domain-containing protein [Mesobacillus subterraneus]RSD26986.1 DUF3006 domain-containing protein [Mesobacillus subterraneus]